MRERTRGVGALAGIVVAGACACGGSSFKAGGTEAGASDDAGRSDAGAGGSVPPSDASAGNEDSGATSGPCPSSMPAMGDSCSREALECEYGSSAVPACDTVATCTKARWTLQAPAPGEQCPSTRSSKCPASFALASLDAHCDSLGMICDYPTGRCACTDGAGPVPLDASAAARWHCQQPGANCPRPRPPLGSACSSDGLSCDYGTCTVPEGSGEACANGLWQTSSFACAL